MNESNPLTVLVLGGTGRTGRAIVEKGAAAGHRMIAFGRSATPESVPEGATAFAGDVLDADAVGAAMVGVDAVVSVLSISRRSRSPFAPITGSHTLHSDATAIWMKAMAEAGVTRVVKISAQGVGDSSARAGWGFRLLVAASNLRPAFENHAVADALLAESSLAWTIARPPMLVEGDGAPLQASETAVTWSATRVKTGAVAAWVVDALQDESTLGRIVTLIP